MAISLALQACTAPLVHSQYIPAGNAAFKTFTHLIVERLRNWKSHKKIYTHLEYLHDRARTMYFFTSLVFFVICPGTKSPDLFQLTFFPGRYLLDAYLVSKPEISFKFVLCKILNQLNNKKRWVCMCLSECLEDFISFCWLFLKTSHSTSAL